MKIAIAGDHAGFSYKKEIILHLSKNSFVCEDFGTKNEDSCDYPDYIHPASKSIVDGKNDLGIFICGSANGVCMTANKYQKIRAAICWNTELAELARLHNNANVICLPARYIKLEDAIEIIDAFLNTEFEGGRHNRRVEKIAIEKL